MKRFNKSFIKEMAKKQVSIKEVAKKAGVSLGTVSKVLNGDTTVKKSNKLRVLKAINELNYTPCRVARSLIKGRTKNIGFIIPDITNPFFPEIVKGASDLLISEGYYVLLCSSDNNPHKEELYLKDLQSMWVDGIIIAPSDTENRDINIFNTIPMPFVVVDREIKGLHKDLVIGDNKDGAYKATKYLIELGHKRIVIIGGLKHTITAQDRFLGWKIAMNEYGLFDKSLVFWSEYSIEAGYKVMKDILSIKKRDSISAVFASNDMIALGAIKAIEEEGLKVPEDISIVGFDDIYLSRFIKPALTVIRQSTYKYGKTAAEILLSRINNNKKYKPKKSVIKEKLIIRDSARKI